jgi:predicted membrane GTPase involved in stress response
MQETSGEMTRVRDVVESVVQGVDVLSGPLDTTSFVKSLAGPRSFAVTSIACRCGTIIGSPDHELSAQ